MIMINFMPSAHGVVFRGVLREPYCLTVCSDTPMMTFHQRQ